MPTSPTGVFVEARPGSRRFGARGELSARGLEWLASESEAERGGDADVVGAHDRGEGGGFFAVVPALAEVEEGRDDGGGAGAGEADVGDERALVGAVRDVLGVAELDLELAVADVVQLVQRRLGRDPGPDPGR